MEKLLVKSFDKDKSNREIAEGVQTINFASWERLRPLLAVAANTDKERVIGLRVIDQGVEIILGEEECFQEEKCYHRIQSRVKTHRGYHCGDCGKRF